MVVFDLKSMEGRRSMVKPKSRTANGEVGYLIWCGGDRYVFRQYDAQYNFKDYDIRHTDMRIKIIDADAHFYEGAGVQELDHCPATLGIK
jgi:hypothetical protein